MVKTTKSANQLMVLFLVTILVGVAAGFGGMFLALLLHYIQHLAYGYSLDRIISDESFLEGVRASSAERRLSILVLCGLIAGWGWWALSRWGSPLVSIAETLNSSPKKMPVVTTIIHALLQIITVALGSPLGREVAPREIGALCASWLSRKAGLSASDIQLMIACGAGAGLTAVYNVPLGGTIFVLEVLLVTFNWRVLIPAMATSAIAVVISWIGLGNEHLYSVASLNISYSLVFWSILIGPVMGFTAYRFSQIIKSARSKAQHNTWQQPVFCLFNFALIGMFAIYLPALLGNGKSPVQLMFDDTSGIALISLLLILRVFITWSTFRAGAYGGLLTPSLAIGALFAALTGNFWNLIGSSTPSSAYAIIGATAFLAAAQKMPITAIVLIFELTRVNFNFLVPILFAVCGSVGMYSLCRNRDLL